MNALLVSYGALGGHFVLLVCYYCGDFAGFGGIIKVKRLPDLSAF